MITSTETVKRYLVDGAAMRAAREQRSVGLREAARQLGVSPTYMSRIERMTERASVSRELFEKIQAMFDDFPRVLHADGDLPKYVKLGINGDTVLRLEEDWYWRAAGAWGVRFRRDGNKLYINEPFGNMSHANGVPLIPCSEAEWRASNGRYV